MLQNGLSAEVKEYNRVAIGKQTFINRWEDHDREYFSMEQRHEAGFEREVRSGTILQIEKNNR